MANWYDGLPVGVANSLLSCGIKSREQLRGISGIDLMMLPKVGFRSVCVIQAWLGRPVPQTTQQLYSAERDTNRLGAQLLAAEELLRDHGYKVTKPKPSRRT